MSNAETQSKPAASRSRRRMEFATLSLDERCHIDDCNAAGEELFGHARGQLIGRPISTLLPELSESALVRDGAPNPYLKFLSRVGYRFKGVNKDERQFDCELFVNFLGNPGSHFATVIVVPAEV